ncbi:MAG: glycosyl hydrolase family 28-related protein, partial [Victivallaceae bacterium]
MTSCSDSSTNKGVKSPLGDNGKPPRDTIVNNTSPGPKTEKNTDICFLAPAAGTVNVKDYGAVGDGIADDTAAIQSAFNFACLQRQRIRVHTMKGWYGGTNDAAYPMIVFPAGTYKISHTLVGYGAMYLKGVGRAIIKQNDAKKDIYYQHGAFRSTIENLAFDGGKVQVHIWTANNDAAKVIITDCRFENSTSEAIRCRSYTQTILEGEKFRQTKPMAPYEVEADSNGFYQIIAEIDTTKLVGWANSTLMIMSGNEFFNCIRAFDISCDGSIVENCKITANPATEGAIMRCLNHTDIKNIVCQAPATKNPQFWIEANSIAVNCRDSVFDSANPMCLVRQTGKPGYYQRTLSIEGCRFNSAGCPEGGVVCLEGIPNALYFTGNTELSGKQVKAVAWKISSSAESFDEQRYFKAIDIATQFNFCIARNSANIDPQLPETARQYIRQDIPRELLAEVGFADRKVFTAEYSPQIENAVFASGYGLKADGATDDSDALQRAVDAAAKLPQSAVILPGRIVKLAKTVKLSSETKLIGAGCAFLTGNGSFSAFSADDCHDLLITNIGFKDFSKGLELKTKSSQNSRVLVYNCVFFDCFEEALECLSDKSGNENKTVIQLKNSEVFGTVATNAAFALISNVWLHGSYLMDNRANIENRGGTMIVESILGVPLSKKGEKLKNSVTGVEKTWELGNNLRWFDNYGKLLVFDTRCGGEQGGACPVYNMSSAGTIFAQGGYFGMNSPNVKSCYAYFVKAPKAAVFSNLGSIPGPIARKVWRKAPDCGETESAIFVSGPGTGLAEKEVSFKFMPGMNVLKNPGFEDITVRNVEKTYAVLFERGVDMQTGSSVPMPAVWTLNEHDGWYKDKGCVFKYVEGEPGKEVFTGKRAVYLASSARATISGNMVKVA